MPVCLMRSSCKLPGLPLAVLALGFLPCQFLTAFRLPSSVPPAWLSACSYKVVLWNDIAVHEKSVSKLSHHEAALVGFEGSGTAVQGTEGIVYSDEV